MTAKDLIYKLLDYDYLWARPDLKNEKPSAIRRKQIEALLEAFGLSKKYVNPLVQIKYSIVGKKEELSRVKQLNKLTNIQYLLQGEFLHDRPYEENKELSEQAINKIKELFEHVPEDRMSRPVDIGWMFNNLWNFRQEIYKVTYPNGGMLEGFSIGLIYSQYLQKELKDLIKDNLENIDNTLWLILDPKQREIEIEELTSRFNYPDVDLDKIDLDWRIDNY
ncbi:hypothetical protein [Flammeovirga sp. SJP92]|uniref:hypothetical protein n=1 Tax=Flammeovirga sp. SJP92 TaxID=1775430 RepID=UPI0007894623|nr:hypothetical protein [Flammeovirga sp. SJP92]KXX71146.1 hypothetical protein AVL50_09955 [Flammeovirga sp. SJP92]